MNIDQDEAAIRYFFEAGMLKRTARSGWWAEKIKDPESVADHSFRAAVIAFVLAVMEGEDAERICTAAVFHDMHEARLGDLNKINARYIEVKKELERKVEKEQVKDMAPALRDSILKTLNLSEKERSILKDADLLENAVQAKEYLDIGYRGAQSWIERIGERLKTRAARRLHSKLRTEDSNSWWKGLKKLD